MPYTTDKCRKCWLAANDSAFRKMWNLPEPAPEPQRRPLSPGKLPDCIHLGESTGEQQQCGSCRGGTGTRLKLFSCALHTKCTIDRALPSVSCCASCPDRQPVFKKHLLYHIYPRISHGKRCDWRWNVGKLLERISLFDGKRIVAIVTDATTDPADHVQDALGDAGCEFVVMPNNGSLREVLTHEPLFSRLADCIAPEDVTLWAHAKGVSNHTWPDQGATIQLWTETLYETMLDHWPLVANLLTRHPIAGSFLRRGKFWSQSASTWHYSGSWCWYRNRDLFARDWRKIDRFDHGAEPYPSLHFTEQEAGVIFANLATRSGDWPYKAEAWRTHLLPELEKWRVEHARHRLEVAP